MHVRAAGYRENWHWRVADDLGRVRAKKDARHAPESAELLRVHARRELAAPDLRKHDALCEGDVAGAGEQPA
jgi:hypothetical protein